MCFEETVDNLIVGPSPIGAVFARELMNSTKTAGKKVLMIDIGPQ